MLRFAVALAAYATRLIVPIVIGATSVGVALLLAVLPLHRVSVPPACLWGLGCGGHWYWAQYAWQIPAALLIGVLGLGLAALIALWNRLRPQSRPVPPPRADVPSGHSVSMLRFYIALAEYSVRGALPFVMTVVVICVALYVGAIPQNDGYYPPIRFGWQIPVALLVGVIGLGLAFGVAVWNRWHPRTRPLPPLPAGWQTGA